MTDTPLSQKYLGQKGMICFLAFLSAFPPLTTDIYLPALPEMVGVLNTTQAMTNLSLSLFFVFYAFGILLWGALSDKYGRKPMLFIGLVIYILASFACAYSQSVEQLIGSRILQAIGGSAATAVATALVKDLYGGAQRARVLAIVMSMVIVAPMVAPVIGAFLLKYASWRAIFVLLAGVGGMGIVSAFFLQETVVPDPSRSVLYTLGRPIAILQNRSLSILLLLFSSTTLALMAYLASASYIYIKYYHLSEQKFSFFFALNAFAAMFGPIIYLRLAKRFRTKKIIVAGFFFIMVGGIWTVILGHISVWMFALGVIITTVSTTIMRPPGAHFILEQHDGDAGSVSSLINFVAMLIGSIGMFLISFDWSDQIYVLGTLQLGVGLLGLLLWLYVKDKPYIKYGEVK